MTMTKREMYSLIKELNVDNEEVVKFCDHELELLDRKSKSGSSTKPTKNQVANEVLKNRIVEIIEENEKITCSAITDILNAERDVEKVAKAYHPNKTVALLKQLVDGGTLERVKDSDGTHYKVVEA